MTRTMTAAVVTVQVERLVTAPASVDLVTAAAPPMAGLTDAASHSPRSAPSCRALPRGNHPARLPDGCSGAPGTARRDSRSYPGAQRQCRCYRVLHGESLTGGGVDDLSREGRHVNVRGLHA